MNEYLSYINDLNGLVEVLLLMDVVLTGAVILLAFRVVHYKHLSEELESRLNEAISSTIAHHTAEDSVPHRRSSRR